MTRPFRTKTPLIAALATLVLYAGPAAAPGFENEQLHYSINWPSGLSLGEATLRSARTKNDKGPQRLHLEFDLDASIPGFVVSDKYRSDTSLDFCSTKFQKTTLHGKKKVNETSTFDQEAGKVTRETKDGGKTELSVSQCGKDALSFLYFARRELSQGRIPPPQTVYFGAPYEVRLEFGGTQKVKVSDAVVETDRVVVNAKGPASEISFEVFFLKNNSRSPALVRVPLQLGSFYMELVK